MATILMLYQDHATGAAVHNAERAISIQRSSRYVWLKLLYGDERMCKLDAFALNMSKLGHFWLVCMKFLPKAGLGYAISFQPFG